MQMKDRIMLAGWLRSNASLADVELACSFGLVDNERFTEHARRAYLLLWTWSAPRFSGRAGLVQDRYWQKCGIAAMTRRFARAQRLAARLSQ